MGLCVVVDFYNSDTLCVFFRSALPMSICVSSGWDRWRYPVGVSTASSVPLGPVWS